MIDDSTSMRTDLCGALRADDAGRNVAVCGWVDRRREHGEHLAFLDVRDRSGTVQCVVDGAADIRPEYVVRVTGTVTPRTESKAIAWLLRGSGPSVERSAQEVPSHSHVSLKESFPSHPPNNTATPRRASYAIA